MGKQVNFYMNAEDEHSFVNFLRSDADTFLMPARLQQRAVENLVMLPKPGDWAWFSIDLWHRGISPEPVMDFIESQKHFYVDKLSSEVIEFARPTKEQGRLIIGRIYAEMQYWNSEQPPQLVRKGSRFIDWFETLAKWIKNQSTRNEFGEYILPGAQAFVASGGRLSRTVKSCAEAL